MAHMNLDYWLEQVKATTAVAADLAVPIAIEKTVVYLPLVTAPKEVSRTMVYLPIRTKPY